MNYVYNVMNIMETSKYIYMHIRHNLRVINSTISDVESVVVNSSKVVLMEVFND